MIRQRQRIVENIVQTPICGTMAASWHSKTVAAFQAERSRAITDPYCTQHYIRFLDRRLVQLGEGSSRPATPAVPRNVGVSPWEWHPVHRLDPTGTLHADDIEVLHTPGQGVHVHAAKLQEQASRPDLGDFKREYMAGRVETMLRVNAQLCDSDRHLSEVQVLHLRHVRAQAQIAARRATRPWVLRDASAGPQLDNAPAPPPSPAALGTSPSGQGRDDVHPAGASPPASPLTNMDQGGIDNECPSSQTPPVTKGGRVQPDATPWTGGSHSAAPLSRARKARAPRMQATHDTHVGGDATHRSAGGVRDASEADGADSGLVLPVSRGVDTSDAQVTVASTDLVSLRPGQCLSDNVVDWMVCTAAIHAWPNEAYIVCNPRHMKALLDNVADSLEGVQMWRRRVDPLADGVDQRKAIIAPILMDGNWSVSFVFHPGAGQHAMVLCITPVFKEVTGALLTSITCRSPAAVVQRQCRRAPPPEGARTQAYPCYCGLRQRHSGHQCGENQPHQVLVGQFVCPTDG